jgi:hypothetical protein
MNHWNQTMRLPRFFVSSWIVAPTIALIAIGATVAPAQDSQSEIELAAPSGFKQLTRLVPSVQAAGSGHPKTSPTDDPRSLVNRHRITSIHERIALIKRLIEQEKAQSQSRQQDLLTDATGVNGAGDVQPTDSQPSEGAANPTEPPAASTEPVGSPSGTPVVSHPINPFELANSLFATGNIAASRRSYEAGLGDATPEDRLWLKCLIGCCYRLEGDFANAETSFREVTRHKRFAYPVDYAKWCLKYLEQRRSSAEQFQVIETELENLLTELPNHDGT